MGGGKLKGAPETCFPVPLSSRHLNFPFRRRLAGRRSHLLKTLSSKAHTHTHTVSPSPVGQSPLCTTLSAKKKFLRSRPTRSENHEDDCRQRQRDTHYRKNTLLLPLGTYLRIAFPMAFTWAIDQIERNLHIVCKNSQTF